MVRNDSSGWYTTTGTETVRKVSRLVKMFSGGSCQNRSQSADECSSARIGFRFRLSFPKRCSAQVWNESMYV
jgi:hypothetical protein